MDRTEFKQWGEDLLRRLPELGTYIRGLAPETRDIWYADIFEPVDLRDAIQVNRRLFESGEASKWERDKLPSLLIRSLAQVRYERLEREADRQKGTATGAWSNVTAKDSQMGRVYREVVRRQDEYRREHSVSVTPDDVRAEWIDEVWN